MESSCLKKIKMLKELYPDIDNKFCSKLELIVKHLFDTKTNKSYKTINYDGNCIISDDIIHDKALIFHILLSTQDYQIKSHFTGKNHSVMYDITLVDDDTYHIIILNYNFVRYAAYVVSQIFLHNWENISVDLFQENSLCKYFINCSRDGVLCKTIKRNNHEISFEIAYQNLISWSFDNVEQYPGNEIFMLHCWHKIHCN